MCDCSSSYCSVHAKAGLDYLPDNYDIGKKKEKGMICLWELCAFAFNSPKILMRSNALKREEEEKLDEDCQ